jgi:hypothetical protein
MNSAKPGIHPRFFGALLALGLLTSIAFAIAASVAPPGSVQDGLARLRSQHCLRLYYGAL